MTNIIQFYKNIFIYDRIRFSDIFFYVTAFTRNMLEFD